MNFDPNSDEMKQLQEVVKKMVQSELKRHALLSSTYKSLCAFSDSVHQAAQLNRLKTREESVLVFSPEGVAEITRQLRIVEGAPCECGGDHGIDLWQSFGAKFADENLESLFAFGGCRVIVCDGISGGAAPVIPESYASNMEVIKQAAAAVGEVPGWPEPQPHAPLLSDDEEMDKRLERIFAGKDGGLT